MDCGSALSKQLSGRRAERNMFKLKILKKKKKKKEVKWEKRLKVLNIMQLLSMFFLRNLTTIF